MKLPVVSCAEMRRIEEQTFAGGISAEDAMEQVGRQVAWAVAQYFPEPGIAEVFYGKGHNGGDALVAARYLARAGWLPILLPQEQDAEKLAPLTRRKLEQFRGTFQRQAARIADAQPARRLSHGAYVVIDGLLGIGAAGPLREDIRALARQINGRRREAIAVFAVDIPTGLDGETGEADPDCVVADFTVTAGYAKQGLVADKAAAHVGRLCVAPLHEFEPFAPESWGETTTPESLRGVLQTRGFDSHKTQFGRVAIVAGSPGFTGAAVLCSTGALRGGAGLVTAYALPDAQPLIAAAAPPEIMVHPVKSYAEVLEQKHDVIGLGPGLGESRGEDIVRLIKESKCPMVVDADGLNLVAKQGVDLFSDCAGPRLLTPHPGEMARLFPESKNLTRRDTVKKFTERFPRVTLLLKGSRTIIGESGKPCSFNTTGNPGMGTGGMGDILTGVCAALIGQHLSLYDAARAGAWLCGRAAEIAVHAGGRSEESLSAMDVAAYLGQAFAQLRSDSL